MTYQILYLRFSTTTTTIKKEQRTELRNLVYQVGVQEGLTNWWLCLQHSCASYNHPNLPPVEMQGCGRPMSNCGTLITTLQGYRHIQVTGDTKLTVAIRKKRLCGSTKWVGKLRRMTCGCPTKASDSLWILAKVRTMDRFYKCWTQS